MALRFLDVDFNGLDEHGRLRVLAEDAEGIEPGSVVVLVDHEANHCLGTMGETDHAARLAWVEAHLNSFHESPPR